MTAFSAVLLAGGNSSRMGLDKALLPVPGLEILLWQRQLRVLEELNPEEIFWSGPVRKNLPARLHIISDEVEKAGPLAGIAAALDAMRSDLLLVLAVDLPWMSAEFLGSLLDKCSKGCGAVGRAKDFFEPLAAFYPKSMTLPAKEHLAAGRYALQDLIGVAIQQGLLQAVPLTDENVPLFKNLNTPSDLSALG